MDNDDENKKDNNEVNKIEIVVQYIVNNYDISEFIALLEEYLPDTSSSDEEDENLVVIKDKDGFLSLA
jgi:hypothetical protein